MLLRYILICLKARGGSNRKTSNIYNFALKLYSSLTICIGMDSQDPNTPSGVDGSWPMGDGAMFVKVGGETP